MRRVTGGFDARKMCDRRRYEYVAPAFVFDPTACRERQWYYDEENAKRRAASEAAAAAAGVQSSEAAGPSGDDAAAAAPPPGPEAAAPQGLGAAAANDAAEPADPVLTEAAEMPADGGSAAPAPANPAADGATNGSHPAPGSSADMGSPDFRFDQACVERLSGILRQYEGTHCFHNFTVKVAATSPEARRYIVRFRCEGTFEMEVRRRTEAPARLLALMGHGHPGGTLIALRA